MTHTERRIYLIQSLLKEQPRYADISIPAGEQEQKNLLRSLFNIRMPAPVSKAFLQIQDDYLQEETTQKGITELASLRPVQERIYLWQGYITTLQCDAVVNAANSALLGCFIPCHGCIDNAIHSAAGVELRLECSHIMEKQKMEEGHSIEEPVGRAKITPAFNLPCRYVLHTVGPIVSGPLTDRHCEQLSDCYRSCLELASKNGLKSLAFCCIATGEFHFPQRTAAEIAVDTVKEFLRSDKKIERVIFNVYKTEDYEIYKRILGQVR